LIVGPSGLDASFEMASPALRPTATFLLFSMDDKSDVKQGTLALMVLKTLQTPGARAWSRFAGALGGVRRESELTDEIENAT
jgi:hypothetical protein